MAGKHVMNGLSGGFGTGGAIGDYGRPLNPHNLDHVTGGSCSGCAAAVAAREVDISFEGVSVDPVGEVKHALIAGATSALHEFKVTVAHDFPLHAGSFFIVTDD